jgi:hypothetical protein
MSTNPNHHDRSSSDAPVKRHAAGQPQSADPRPRSSEHGKDDRLIPIDDSDLPTHVVGEHHTD